MALLKIDLQSCYVNSLEQAVQGNSGAQDAGSNVMYVICILELCNLNPGLYSNFL
jgi:hypothetical protein